MAQYWESQWRGLRVGKIDFEQVDMAFIPVVCCISGNGGSNGGRKHSIVKRPALVGAVPMYYLMRAGRELRSKLPGIFEATVRDEGDGGGEKKDGASVMERVLRATEDAAYQLALRDDEIAVLTARCDELQRALLLAKRRAENSKAGNDVSELGRTAAMFQANMTAAECRAVSAERQVETLTAKVKTLECKLQNSEADAVKTVLVFFSVVVGAVSLSVRAWLAL